MPTTKLPVRIPADPKPWIALPMIRTTEEGARAQIKLPISKTIKAFRNEDLVSKDM